MGRNKNLLLWKEFGNEHAPSIRTAFQETSYEGMSTIAEYLDKRGSVIICSPERNRDVITNELLGSTKALLTDGEYTWDNSLSYYVRRYNLRLPSDFENKVLGSTVK